MKSERPVKSRSGARREEIPGWTAVKDSKAWYREIQIIWPIFGLSWDRGWPLLNWGKFYNISDRTNVCRTPFFLWRKLFMLWSRSLLEIFLWMLRCSKNKNATKKQTNKWTTKEYHAIPKLPTIQSKCRLFGIKRYEVKTSGQMSLVVHGPVVVDDRYKRFATTFTSPVKWRECNVGNLIQMWNASKTCQGA